MEEKMEISAFEAVFDALRDSTELPDHEIIRLANTLHFLITGPAMEDDERKKHFALSQLGSLSLIDMR